MNKRPTHCLVIALSLLICCGQNGSSAGCTAPAPRPSGPNVLVIAGAIVGAAAVGTIVLVSVNSSQHNLRGCLFSTPSGLQLRTDDKKDYTLVGGTANLTVGNKVHVHGTRQKHNKNDPAGHVFLVSELKKNYGPCSVLNASANAPDATPPTVAPAQP